MKYLELRIILFMRLHMNRNPHRSVNVTNGYDEEERGWRVARGRVPKTDRRWRRRRKFDGLAAELPLGGTDD